MTIRMLIKRNTTTDGWYEYQTESRIKGKRGSLWLPKRDRLHNAHININQGCWKEGTVEGTMLHEMVHQYQAEVLDLPTSHDAIFCSIARRLERKYGIYVR